MKLTVTRSRDERGSAGGLLLIALFIVLVLVVLTWYFDSSYVASRANRNATAGWFAGLLNGLLAVPSFIASLFSDNYGIYRANNTGGWYNFWFLLGVGGVFGGAGSRS